MTLDQTAQNWVDQAIAKLTLRQKIGQLIVPMFTKATLDGVAVDEWLEKYPIGGGHVFGGPLEETFEFIEAAQAGSDMPLLISGDLDKGGGDRIKEGTLFQCQMALGAADSEELAYKLGKAIAIENLAAGYNWTFSPIVDICAGPDYLRHIAAISEDPKQIARLAIAEIKGLQDHGMAACSKHFPGDGYDDRDQHLTTLINPLGAEEWFEKSGYPFQQTIDAGVYSIMNSCFALPSLDPESGDVNFPRPAIVSKPLIEDLLRDRMGFDGVLVTDALNMGGITHHYAQPERYALALEAGNDVLLFVTRLEQSFDYLVECVESGSISIEQVDGSVRRVLTMKAKIGLHEPVSKEEKQEKLRIFDNSPFKQDAKELAEKSITLVQDKDGVLPLKGGELKIAHVLITNREEEFDAGEFVKVLTDGGNEVERFLNPGAEEMYDEIASGKYDVVITSLYFPIQWGWNNVKTHGPYCRAMMTGYEKACSETKAVFVSFVGPYHLYEMPFMDTFLTAWGEAKCAQEAAGKAVLGEIEIVGKLPVTLAGVYNSSIGLKNISECKV